MDMGIPVYCLPYRLIFIHSSTFLTSGFILDGFKFRCPWEGCGIVGWLKWSFLFFPLFFLWHFFFLLFLCIFLFSSSPPITRLFGIG